MISLGILFAALALFACSGSGGMSGSGVPDAQSGDARRAGKDESAGTASGSGSGSRRGTASGSDGADQPIMITGTYLACAFEELKDSEASFSCDWRTRPDERKVDLERDVKKATWSYALPTGTIGAVKTLPLASSAEHHVLYQLEASSHELLTKLLASFGVVLDIVTLDGKNLSSKKLLSQLVALKPDQAPPPPVEADVFVPDVLTKPETPSETPPELQQPVQPQLVEPMVVTPPTGPAPEPESAPSPQLTSDGPQPLPPLPAPGPSDAGGSGKFANRHWPNTCNAAGSGEYTIKDTFFRQDLGAGQPGARSMGRTTTYWSNAACSGDPVRVARSVPELSPWAFATDVNPPAGAIIVTYDQATQRVSFSIRMEGKSTDEKVSFSVAE